MRHRYVAEQTLVSASLLSFLYVHVAAGEYCMAFTRQQKMRDPRQAQPCRCISGLEFGSYAQAVGPGVAGEQVLPQWAPRGPPACIFGVGDVAAVGRSEERAVGGEGVSQRKCRWWT